MHFNCTELELIKIIKKENPASCSGLSSFWNFGDSLKELSAEVFCFPRLPFLDLVTCGLGLPVD